METYHLQNKGIEWRVVDFGVFRRIFSSHEKTVETRLTIKTLKEGLEKYGSKWETELRRQSDKADPIYQMMQQIPIRSKKILLLGDQIGTEAYWLAKKDAKEITLPEDETSPLTLKRLTEEEFNTNNPRSKATKWDLVLCICSNKNHLPEQNLLKGIKTRHKKNGTILFLSKQPLSVKNRIWIRWNLPEAKTRTAKAKS